MQVFVGFWGYQNRWGSQIFLQVFESLLGLLSPLELVMFLEELKPATGSHDPVNFCVSWRLSSGFILVIADTFSGLWSIPRWETIYLSSFLEGTPDVHF
jgi:hypothetical protein